MIQMSSNHRIQISSNHRIQITSNHRIQITSNHRIQIDSNHRIQISSCPTPVTLRDRSGHRNHPCVQKPSDQCVPGANEGVDGATMKGACKEVLTPVKSMGWFALGWVGSLSHTVTAHQHPNHRAWKRVEPPFVPLGLHHDLF